MKPKPRKAREWYATICTDSPVVYGLNSKKARALETLAAWRMIHGRKYVELIKVREVLPRRKRK
jgi:hypothetical protein